MNDKNAYIPDVRAPLEWTIVGDMPFHRKVTRDSAGNVLCSDEIALRKEDLDLPVLLKVVERLAPPSREVCVGSSACAFCLNVVCQCVPDADRQRAGERTTDTLDGFGPSPIVAARRAFAIAQAHQAAVGASLSCGRFTCAGCRQKSCEPIVALPAPPIDKDGNPPDSLSWMNVICQCVSDADYRRASERDKEAAARAHQAAFGTPKPTEGAVAYWIGEDAPCEPEPQPDHTVNFREFL